MKAADWKKLSLDDRIKWVRTRIVVSADDAWKIVDDIDQLVKTTKPHEFSV